MKRAKKYFNSAIVSMSKMKNWFSTLFIASFCVFLFCAQSAAQDFEATVKLDPASGILQIEGKFLKKNILESPKNFAFARPIKDLTLIDKENRQIVVKKLIEGEYLAESAETAVWNYQIDVKSAENFTAKAHNSWLENEQGILMTGDLLPQFFGKNGKKISARIKFDLPENWKIFTSEKRENENAFILENIRKAVFAIGKNWRKREIKLENSVVNLLLTGEWRFSDAQAAEMTREILENYKNLFGGFAGEKAQINLVPAENSFGRWQAETRGDTLTIISGDMPFEKQSVQRLHEQLRHELFHLWIPNNLSLTGNYDWFYEGFTVYQSLRTGLEMNRLSFTDFLETLAQSYNLANFQNQQISLVEASKTRKSGANREVYARGLLAAFLCDVALLQKNRGNRDLSEIFREIYQTHRLPNAAQDGNIAVLRILKTRAELRFVIENYIEGTKKIDWTRDLELLGIEEIRENSGVKLRVKDKLNKRQKDLLDKLGYNNWRRLAERSK